MHASSKASHAGHKGISPLISTVLIIAIGVIISMTLLSWSSAVTQSHQATVTNRSSNIVGCVTIDIRDVYLDFVANRSAVLVWSNGNTDIISAQLLSKSGAQATLNTTLPLAITAGSIQTIYFNLSTTIPACANFSQVIVSTSCISDRFAETPRGC